MLVIPTDLNPAELWDRESIRDCLYRYCRGIDRCDAETLRSAFWEDAIGDYGSYVGRRDDLVNTFIPTLKAMDQTQHTLANILIEIEGDVAKVESYVRAYHRIRFDRAPFHREGDMASGVTKERVESLSAPRDLIQGGRYLDRMEKRDNEWRIARRRLVTDWIRQYDDSADWDVGAFVGCPSATHNRMPLDPVYELLGVTPSRNDFWSPEG